MTSTLVRPAAALLVVGLAVGLRFQPDEPAPAPAPAPVVRPAIAIDATSDAEARVMRHATQGLADELRVAAGCEAGRSQSEFADCVAPALQHAGTGGRTAAMLLRGVIARVPRGRCGEYLLRLQAASGAAGDNAPWLLARLYEARRRPDRVYISGQIALAASMLHRASLAAAADVCAPAAWQPAI
jgi:hypothetical protein